MFFLQSVKCSLHNKVFTSSHCIKCNLCNKPHLFGEVQQCHSRRTNLITTTQSLNIVLSRHKHFNSGNIIRKDIASNFDTCYTNLIVENISKNIREWMCQRIDDTDNQKLPALEKVSTFNRLLMVHCFELFLLSKYPVSSTGISFCDCEVAIPAMCVLVDRALEHGGDTFVIGLSQLKRFKALSRLLNTTPEELFMGLIECRNNLTGLNLVSDFIESSFPRRMGFHLLGAPSLPSAVFPLVIGKARGTQIVENDENFSRVWPIVCYTSSEISSKDVFSNIVKISNDESYTCGGTIHLVINNEIDDGGSPKTETSCKFLKIFAEFMNSPVIHVHANDVDSVISSMWLAADYKAAHKRDIVIDLIVGSFHNLPSKQMSLTGLIKELVAGEKFPLVAAYMKDLIKEKVIAKVSYNEKRDECMKKLNRIYCKGQKMMETDCESIAINLKKLALRSTKAVKEPATGSSFNVLNKIGKAISKKPLFMSLSAPDLEQLEMRQKCLETNKLDWDFCEAMASGTLLQEGTNVHISCSKKYTKLGLTVEDGENGRQTNLMDKVYPFLGLYQKCCSEVPQFATAGYETGYSSVKTNTLNVWMASDDLPPQSLHNIISNYLAFNDPSIQSQIGVTYVLPNYTCISERNTELYYSTQPEKILDMFDDPEPSFTKTDQSNSNVMIVNVSTPANYYHLVKRQARCPRRKPLIVYVPFKFHFPEEGHSKMEDLATDSSFQPFIYEKSVIELGYDIVDIILCSGKLYYDLASERQKRNLENRVSIGRVEQLYPFPYKNVLEFLVHFPNARIWWAQEEQYNDGWWSFIESRLFSEQINVKYAGRYHVTAPKYQSPKMSDAQLTYIFESILENH